MMRNILVDGLDVHNFGGIESYLCQVLPGLNDYFHFDLAVPGKPESSRYGRLTAPNINYVLIRRRRESVSGNIEDIEEILSNGNYDAVWLHRDSLSNIELLRRAKAHDVPSIIMQSHRSSLVSMSVLRVIAHYLHRDEAYECATEHWACSRAAGKLFYGSKKYDVVNNCIDVNSFRFSRDDRKRIRDEFRVTEHQRLIGTVGRLDPVKNQVILIDILNEMEKRGIDAKLLIVGSGPEEKRIKDRAESLRLQEKVMLAGPRADIPAVLSAMDAFVLPSKTEALSIAALEAQASGIAVVIPDRLKQAVPDLGRVYRYESDSMEDCVDLLADLLTRCESKDRSIDLEEFGAYDCSSQVNVLRTRLGECIEGAMK